MPELPEVETVRNYLKENILNKKIINIDILYPKMIENDINEFKKKLINNFFIDIPCFICFPSVVIVYII